MSVYRWAVSGFAGRSAREWYHYGVGLILFRLLFWRPADN